MPPVFEPRLADESNSGSRFFSRLVDHNAEAGVDWTVPFKQWSSLPSKLALGGSAIFKDRSIDNRRLSILASNQLASSSSAAIRSATDLQDFSLGASEARGELSKLACLLAYAERGFCAAKSLLGCSLASNISARAGLAAAL